MEHNTDFKYIVHNPQKEDCPVCSMFNTLYEKKGFYTFQRLPEAVGQGGAQRYQLSPAVEIFVTDTTFHETFTLESEAGVVPRYSLAFCLREPLDWRMGDSRKEYRIGEGESYLSNGFTEKSACTYVAQRRFSGISLQYKPEAVGKLMTQREDGKSSALQKVIGSGFVIRRFSPHIRMLLNDILNCRYTGDIKRIYLEGKALELLAVYLDENLLEEEAADPLRKLSAGDIQALYQAKEILDGNIPCAPTIGQLSRLACLNEFKLKAGFRELFGMPVHAYIIDKRLELARRLIKEKGISVTEASYLVGYSNTNYFTLKFKEKFGIKPSEYRKDRG